MTDTIDTEELNDVEETFDEIKKSWFTYELIGYFCVYLFLVFGLSLDKCKGLEGARKTYAKYFPGGNSIFMWQIFYIFILCFVCRCVAYAADIFNFEKRIELLTQTAGQSDRPHCGQGGGGGGAAYTLPRAAGRRSE